MTEVAGRLRALKSEIADGMRIDWDVPIQMDDGVVLRADVYRPVDDGRYPVLITYGPYAKNLPFEQGYAGFWKQVVADDPAVTEGTTGKYVGFEVPDPEKWVRDGYAIVRVDSRGAGRSPGRVENFSEREVRDYHDCIEWAGTQEWSSGKVGTTGTSYFGMMSWYVANLRPPHLAGMYLSEAAVDYYRDSARHGGILNRFTKHWFASQVQSVQHGLGKRGHVNPFNGMLISGDEELSDEALRENVGMDPFVAITERPLAPDKYYQTRTAKLDQMQVPFVSVGSWGALSIHLRGNVEGFVGAAAEKKYLSVVNGSGYVYFHSEAGREHQRRFFDHVLKGEGDLGQEPRVRLEVRHVDGTSHLRGEDAWPLPATQWQKLYLDPGAQTLGAGPPAGEVTATYRGFEEGITFRTEPFTEATEIVGPVAAKLFLSSSTTDADVFAVLRLFAPDGSEVLFRGQPDPKSPLSQGWLRASHRKLDAARSQVWRPFHAHDEEQPLTPGEVYELDVEIWPTSIVVPEGYTLALTIQGKDFDHGLEPAVLPMQNEPIVMRGSGHFLHDVESDRPAGVFDGEVTLHAGGDRAAYLLLPVIPH